ncbi:hypothetical protein ACJX0J_025147, partial [Zea mays]
IFGLSDLGLIHSNNKDTDLWGVHITQTFINPHIQANLMPLLGSILENIPLWLNEEVRRRLVHSFNKKTKNKMGQSKYNCFYKLSWHGGHTNIIYSHLHHEALNVTTASS